MRDIFQATTACARIFGLAIIVALVPPQGFAATVKQRSLIEWRVLTSPTNQNPRVFIKGDNVRVYFQAHSNVVEFTADWQRLRVPSEGYKVNTALLHWTRTLARVPEVQRGWRAANVIAGNEWRRMANDLLAELAPQFPGHGFYYQAFLADRLLYRDTNGVPRFAPVHEEPAGITIEHRFSVEESLDILARAFERHLPQAHPNESLFFIMAPNAGRFPQPLILDRQQRQCVCLAPAALYDPTERGFGVAGTFQGIEAMLFESHVIALLKNPVSSAARLGDLGLQTIARVARLPLPAPHAGNTVLTNRPGMDLAAWESWLDRYTGTRREDGSLGLLIDGDRFFSRLQNAFESASNHIHVNMFIFDKDDVAVGVADQLKRRSSEIDVKLVLDRMGTLAGGASPPATPMPEAFVPPASISTYLCEDSHVHLRNFLNPWFSADHCKTILVDNTIGFIGGMNIGREYRYEWHDLMVELHGPVVSSFEKEFRHQWAHAGPLGDLAYAASLVGSRKSDRPPGPPDANLAPTVSATNDSPRAWSKVRRLPTKTFWKPFSAAVLGSIRKSQSYIYAENPYLFDKKVLRALAQARDRGVDVRVILPRVNDFKAGGRGNLVAANFLLQHGVRVYFYPGMTHVKALLVDGWACVGSGNLNHLSLRLCQEQNIATSDPAFAAQLKHDLFEQDFAHCYELNHSISVDWVDFMADLVLGNF